MISAIRLLPLVLMTLALPAAPQALPSNDPVEHPPRPDRAGVASTGPYDYGVMGPPATPAIVAAAEKKVAQPIPPGPFRPTW